jgi:hypothetical protein
MLCSEEGSQTPSGRSKQLENDIPSHSVSTSARKSVKDIRRYFHEAVWDLMGASRELNAGRKISVSQRRPRPQYCSVDQRGEDLSTSQLSLHYLIGDRRLVTCATSDTKHLPILLRSLRISIYRSMVGMEHICSQLTGTTSDKAKRRKAIGGYPRSARLVSSRHLQTR